MRVHHGEIVKAVLLTNGLYTRDEQDVTSFLESCSLAVPCPQAEAAAAAAAAEPEDVQMEELEQEILEAVPAPEEPDLVEDELTGEPEEENTGKCPIFITYQSSSGLQGTKEALR